MKKILLYILLLCGNVLFAQDSLTKLTTIADTSKRYMTAAELKYSKSVAVSSETFINWKEASIWEKAIYLIKGVFKSNPFLAWMLTIVFCFWLLKQVFKLFNK